MASWLRDLKFGCRCYVVTARPGVATDETIAVLTPEGDAVIDEKPSVAGDDGELYTDEEAISSTEVDEEGAEALRCR
jgi:hypothetical protein